MFIGSTLIKSKVNLIFVCAFGIQRRSDLYRGQNQRNQVTFALQDKFRHRAGLAAGGAPVFRRSIGERWMIKRSVLHH